MRTPIKIRFQNGLDEKAACNEILNELTHRYIFERSDDPDFILFGPYGNDIPMPGNYVRIGYFCENIKPDLSICEWAFGMPREDEINDVRYKKIQWHDLTPQQLTKPLDYNAEQILEDKKYFCNFLYSHKVPYREAFFKKLSNYKKVAAPGRSMNNMPGIDEIYTGDVWERKQKFLSEYKFTIAFENDVYPGYQTEKLYHAMLSNSIPIYFGDPTIGEIFNTKAFINAADHITQKSVLYKWLEKHCQADFVDIRPQYYHNLFHRIKRKLKAIGRDVKMQLLFKSLDLSSLIGKIIELDQSDIKYREMLRQPWLNNNVAPADPSLKRWIEIFETPIHK